MFFSIDYDGCLYAYFNNLSLTNIKVSLPLLSHEILYTSNIFSIFYTIYQYKMASTGKLVQIKYKSDNKLC